MSYKPELIVVHCSASKETVRFTFDDCVKYHKSLGWKTCGYHRYITQDGMVHVGRPYNMMGAHAGKEWNPTSIGICYEGGLDAKGNPKDTRTEAQKKAIIRVINEIKSVYNIKRIVGHRDLSPDLDGDGIVEPHEWIKSCPCYEAEPEYKHLLL